MWEIISGVLGILGFAISVVQLISSAIGNRRNLLFHLDAAYIRGNSLLIRYRVDNLSDKAINLTSVQLITDSGAINANYISIFATESTYRSGEDVIFHQSKGTDTLPINLSAGESHGGHLSFVFSEDSQPSLEMPLSFRVSTSHGEPFQMKLSQNGDFQVR